MINEKVESVLNAQINKEFYSAYLYLAMSAYFDEIGLPGFANWTNIQSREEVDHGMILFAYIAERGGKINFTPIEAPIMNLKEPIEIFEKILEHEQSVTAGINCIASMSAEECDLATRNYINRYIEEQVGEEDKARKIINRLKMIGNDRAALYMLDKELRKREYVEHTYKH